MERPLSRVFFPIASILLALSLSACAASTTLRTGQVVQNSAASGDSILGHWRLNGPKPRPSMMSQMYELTFSADRRLRLTYVPGYTMFGSAAFSPKQIKHMTRVTSISIPYNVRAGKLTFTWGSLETYNFVVKNDRLILTRSEPSTGDAQADAEAAAEETTTFLRQPQ